MLDTPGAWALLWFLAGCGAQPPATGSVVPSPAPAELLATDQPGLVGTLVLNVPQSMIRPDAYCLDDGHRYTGAPARIGPLNVFAGGSPATSGRLGELSSSRLLARLQGSHVVARGEILPSLSARLVDSGPCPDDFGSDPAELPQMRGDQISPEGGFRTTRAQLEALQAFQASQIDAVDLGGVVATGDDQVTLELRNPFAEALDGLEAHAHYEGGPGKPMPRLEPIALALPPGGSQRLVLATLLDVPPGSTRRSAHRLASIDLEGQIGEVRFSVVIPAR